MKLVRIKYEWKCSCWVKIDDFTSSAEIQEQIRQALIDDNQDYDEGPNNVEILEEFHL